MATQDDRLARLTQGVAERAKPCARVRQPANPEQRTGPFKNAAKREAIMDAAAQLFVHQGVQRTSLEQIAKAAGVAKQTIYSHFDNKDALFAAGLPRVFARHGFDLEQITAGQDAAEILRRLLHGYLSVVLDPQVIAINRVVMAEAEQYPDIARLCWQNGPARSCELFGAVIAYLSDQGLVRVDDVEQAAAELRVLAATGFREQLLFKVVEAVPKPVLATHLEHLIAGFLAKHRV